MGSEPRSSCYRTAICIRRLSCLHPSLSASLVGAAISHASSSQWQPAATDAVLCCAVDALKSQLTIASFAHRSPFRLARFASGRTSSPPLSPLA